MAGETACPTTDNQFAGFGGVGIQPAGGFLGGPLNAETRQHGWI